MMFRQRDRSTRRGRGEGQGEEREQNITEIIEFSCPYGCVSHDRDTLEKTGRVFEIQGSRVRQIHSNAKKRPGASRRRLALDSGEKNVNKSLIEA
jgi:hypothetical protein